MSRLGQPQLDAYENWEAHIRTKTVKPILRRSRRQQQQQGKWKPENKVVHTLAWLMGKRKAAYTLWFNDLSIIPYMDIVGVTAGI